MPANYVLLQRIELNASAASVTFSNIPQSGYTDLKIVWSLRQSTGPNNDIYISFNGSTSSFSSRSVEGAGSATNSGTVARYLGTVTNTTANTFASGEVYIPNYTSSNNKSFSSDNVGEANATQAYATLAAGLWSNTAAINSVTITPGAGNWVQYSTFSLYGLAAVGTTPVIAPKATGGNITSDGTYWIHTFNSTGTFTPLQGLTCDYLVVAGGGGSAGGNDPTEAASGGGAGGFLTGSLSIAAATNYTITVGAGGNGVGAAATGGRGSNSVFSSVTASGGGGGASAQGATGSSGGSGGGASRSAGSPITGASGTAGQGNKGGDNLVGVQTSAGGGGGAGAVGGNASGTTGGNGGAGTASSITGTSVTYAGGGGAGGTTAQGSGGAGGGASAIRNNVTTNPFTAAAGTVNTGGGGGAHPSSVLNTVTFGGPGGSGIVVIRYPIA